MKCPNCGKEMMRGYLQGGNRMAFNQRIHKLSLLPKDTNDMMIVNNSVTASVFGGFMCKDCSLIVFDYTNPDVKEA